MKQKQNLNDFLNQVEGSESFSYRFHKLTEINNLQKLNKTNKIPEAWSTIHFKTYPRSKGYSLQKNDTRENKITKLLTTRRSTRKFNSVKIDIHTLSDILHYSAGLVNIDTKNSINTTSRRPYPSAGARYPLEIYVVIINGERIKNGLYHYDVKDNKLEYLREFNIENWIDKAIQENWAKESSAIFIITSVFERTTIKYKDRGYRYSLIEAGHLGQNIILTSMNLGFKSCPLGGFIDKEVIELLDLQLIKEIPLYMIAVGK